jgi:hypothetical protein
MYLSSATLRRLLSSRSLRRTHDPSQHGIPAIPAILARKQKPSARPFTRSSQLASQQLPKSQGPPPGRPSQASPNGNPSLPAFSFQGLGMSRTTKTVVLVAIGILGTVETVFWFKAGYRYFFPQVESGGGGEATQGSET